MRLFLLSAVCFVQVLADRRILKNYERKLNEKEGQIVGGMVKRYRCIEEYVPIEEATDHGITLSSLKKKKLHGVKMSKSDAIKPRNMNTNDVEALLNVKTPDQKSDSEIEKMLAEDAKSSGEDIAHKNVIRPQKHRENELFDHELSRGVPISQLSRDGLRKRPRPGRQFYVYDFDENEEYEEEEYYDERPRKRFGMRRRFSPAMRRNPFYYSQRLPYHPDIRQSSRQYLPPVIPQQYRPIQSQPYLQHRPANLQPVAVVQQPLPFTRPDTLNPPVLMEKAERVDPSKAPPFRPVHRLKMNPLPKSGTGTVPLPPQPLPGAVPNFSKGQLEDASPENCKKITQFASQFGIGDVSKWSHNNCGTMQMFVPGATCQQLWHFVDSCHKRRFF